VLLGNEKRDVPAFRFALQKYLAFYNSLNEVSLFLPPPLPPPPLSLSRRTCARVDARSPCLTIVVSKRRGTCRLDDDFRSVLFDDARVARPN